MMGKHSCGDSRITCVDCGTIICSKCLVQCPVGFRCGSCGRVKNSLSSLTPLAVAKTLAMCGVAGSVGGWLTTFISVPFLDCIIAFFVGIVLGRLLTRVIDYRLGRGFTTTVVFGVLIGMTFSPYGLLPMIIGEVLTAGFTNVQYGIVRALTEVVNELFVPVCFFIGIMRATVWGERF